jgi:hypothetical protein
MSPQAPHDLAERGAAFWREVVGAYDLRPDERELLGEACRALDRLDELREAVKTGGLVVTDSRGRVALHPAAVEERQVRNVLRLTLAQLALPDESGDDAKAHRARAAADARWSRAS